MHNTYRPPTAEEAAAVEEIRRRPAYGLARTWIRTALEGQDAPFTKGLHISIGSVTILLKASFVGCARARVGHNRPAIAAALLDQDAEVSVALALADSGARIDLARDSTTGERVLACNVKERLLWAFFRSRSHSGHMGPSVFDAPATLQ
ncbi:MAG: hypothetical protein JF607_17490 [Burkholderiales bacterium]|jgi:hypothetical protein|nr:hypothetical protein [Burkholderiales bacterium]